MDRIKFTSKDLEIIKFPELEKTGVGIFHYMDYFSVFHYGRMPNEIPGKGKAICEMTKYNFDLLVRNGIKNHLLEFIPPNKIKTNLFQSPILTPDYIKCKTNRFIPLQVIFRNKISDKSSIIKRIETNEKIQTKFGVIEIAGNKMVLQHPIVEFTTKESIDKYIENSQAIMFGRISKIQLDQIIQLALEVNKIITDHANQVGLSHDDGKIEVSLSAHDEIILVDSVGTPDENRFVYKEFHMGKQILRDYYKSIGFDERIQHWIESGKIKSEWPQAPEIPDELISIVSAVYNAISFIWVHKLKFSDVEKLLDPIVDNLNQVKNKYGF